MGFNLGFKGLNELYRFVERRNLVSARVPSHFKSTLRIYEIILSHSPNLAVFLCFTLTNV